MKTVAILQARLHSTRLPNKMLLPLLDKPLVQHVVERTLRASTLHQVVVAYPLRDHAAFAFLAQTGCGLYAYPGDEADLVGRYVACAKIFKAEVIVRIPCDNPCVDPHYIDLAVTSYRDLPCLYESNTTDIVGITGGVKVDGIGAEVTSYSRMQWLDDRLTAIRDLGPHVARWREHPHQFWEEYGAFRLFPAQIRLDVNTQEEYEKMVELYTHFGHNHFTSHEVVSWLLPQGDPYARCER